MHMILTNQHMHICPCSWALGICKNIGIWNYFASVTAKSMGGFRHSCGLYKSARTCHFFVPKNCIFWDASFETLKKLTTSCAQKFQVFMEPPYTIVTPYHLSFQSLQLTLVNWHLKSCCVVISCFWSFVSKLGPFGWSLRVKYSSWCLGRGKKENSSGQSLRFIRVKKNKKRHGWLFHVSVRTQLTAQLIT